MIFLFIAARHSIRRDGKTFDKSNFIGTTVVVTVDKLLSQIA